MASTRPVFSSCLRLQPDLDQAVEVSGNLRARASGPAQALAFSSGCLFASGWPVSSVSAFARSESARSLSRAAPGAARHLRRSNAHLLGAGLPSFLSLQPQLSSAVSP